MKQASFDQLEKELYEVSDPSHSRYGQHLSTSDIHALTAPTEDALVAVEAWLQVSLKSHHTVQAILLTLSQGHGISADNFHYSPPRDWITIALPVSKVESLLNTEYHEYRHENGAEVVRTTEYSLPRSLHGHIDVIQPTNYFGNPKHHGSGVQISDFDLPVSKVSNSRLTVAAAAAPSANISAICANPTNSVSSLCVRTLYNTVDYIPKAPLKNYVGITNYLNETPSDGKNFPPGGS